MPGTAFRETADAARPFPVRSRGRDGEAEGNGKSDGLRPRRLRPSGRGGRSGRGKTACDRYDDYDATEMPYTAAIPSDYGGVRGVPVSFLDRYRPEQFEILGAAESEGKGFSNGLIRPGSTVKQPLIGGARVYKRIFIRKKKQSSRARPAAVGRARA